MTEIPDHLPRDYTDLRATAPYGGYETADSSAADDLLPENDETDGIYTAENDDDFEPPAEGNAEPPGRETTPSPTAHPLGETAVAQAAEPADSASLPAQPLLPGNYDMRQGIRLNVNREAKIMAQSSGDYGLVAAIHSLSPSRFRNMGHEYNLLIDATRTAIDSGHAYELDVYNRVPDRGDLILIPNIIGMFHGERREDIQQDGRRTIFDAGVKILSDTGRTMGDVVHADRRILDATYSQVSNMKAVHTRPVSIMRDSQLTGPQKFAARLAEREINGRPKPPEVAEALWQTIPRFVWDGHALPSDIPVPEAYQPRLQEHWSGYTPPEADYLATPTMLANGQAPFHKAMQAADAVAADGYPDAAYQLKTHLIFETREREALRYNGPGTEIRKEIPFFEFIVPGAITGELGRPPKGAHYDYAGALRSVFDETWSRVQQESTGNQPGSAHGFMDKLMQSYGPEVVPYLARSLLQSEQRGGVDVVTVLRNLGQNDQPWVDQLIRDVAAATDRPILTTNELADFASESAPTSPGEAIQSADIIAATNRLGKDNDLYGFTAPLMSVANIPRNVNATISVDLEPVSRTAQATIYYKASGVSRRVPLQIDLTSGAVALHTIDQQHLSPDIESTYRAIVVRAIVNESVRLEDVAALVAAKATRTGNMQSMTSNAAAQPEHVEAKVKTRGTADEGYEPEGVSEAEATLPADTPGDQLIGTDVDSITALLAGQNIRGVSSEQLAQKISYLHGRSVATRISFGKRALIPGKTDTKLRQVNLSTDGRRIRLFFEEGSHGVLHLAGIFDKGRDDVAKETQFMIKLVKRLTPTKTSGPGKHR